MNRSTRRTERRRLIVATVLALALAVPGTAWILTSVEPATKAVAMHGYITQSNLDVIADRTAYVVEGTVASVLPAEWTTLDGLRPERDSDIMTPGAQLRTPVLLEVDTVYRGENVPPTLLFSQAGGTVDGLTVGSFFGFELEEGTRVVAFLKEAPADAGRWALTTPLYPHLLFEVDGDTLHGPLAPISRAEFEAQVGPGGAR